MNILMIAPEQIPLPPPSSGSVETCMYQIAKQLAKKHKVTIMSRRHSRYRNITKMGNLNIVRVATGSSKKYISNVLKYVKNRHFDFVQVDNRPLFVPIVKQYFPNTPVSIFLHSLTFVTPPKTSVKTAAHRLSSADLIVSNSRSLKTELKSLFPELSEKIEVTHLGVDTKHFRPPTAALKKRLRAKRKLNNAFVIVFAGRLIPLKGLPILIKAASIAQKSIPKVKLVIAGNSRRKSYIKSLRKLAATRRVSSKFLGVVPSKKMREIYWIADCFVCPSQGHEAFGLVAVEAMASGVPIIASNNGGLREIIKHDENGVLVDHYQDPNAFADAIVSVWRNKQKYHQLSHDARNHVVRQFSWKSTADRLENMYRRGLK